MYEREGDQKKKSWGSCFLLFRLSDGNEILCAARDGSVNDPIADSAHVFLVMSDVVAASILSNYLLFHWGEEVRRKESGRACDWKQKKSYFFFTLSILRPSRVTLPRIFWALDGRGGGFVLPCRIKIQLFYTPRKFESFSFVSCSPPLNNSFRQNLHPTRVWW